VREARHKISPADQPHRLFLCLT